MALDAADFADPDRGVDPRHIDTGLGDDHGDPLARIGRAADDLRLALVGCHLADVQPVGIGVLLGLHHLADRKGAQAFGGVSRPLRPPAPDRSALCDLIQAGLGVKMVFQPGQGEFHRLSSTKGTLFNARLAYPAQGENPAACQGLRLLLFGNIPGARGAGPSLTPRASARNRSGVLTPRSAAPGCRSSPSATDGSRAPGAASA